jgi:hypothetical protein
MDVGDLCVDFFALRLDFPAALVSKHSRRLSFFWVLMSLSTSLATLEARPLVETRLSFSLEIFSRSHSGHVGMTTFQPLIMDFFRNTIRG